MQEEGKQINRKEQSIFSLKNHDTNAMPTLHGFRWYPYFGLRYSKWHSRQANNAVASEQSIFSKKPNYTHTVRGFNCIRMAPFFCVMMYPYSARNYVRTLDNFRLNCPRVWTLRTLTSQNVGSILGTSAHLIESARTFKRWSRSSVLIQNVRAKKAFARG